VIPHAIGVEILRVLDYLILGILRHEGAVDPQRRTYACQPPVGP
jgi:hypothetical protein